MSEISSTRLADLWTRHLAGESLSQEERDNLADSFAADEVFRRRVLNDYRLDGALRAEADVRRNLPRMLKGIHDILRAATRSDYFVARLRPRLESAAADARTGMTDERRRTRARRTMVASIAVAAGLAAVFAFGFPPTGRHAITTASRNAETRVKPARQPITLPSSPVAGSVSRHQPGPVETVGDDDARRALLVTGGDDSPDLVDGPADLDTGDDRLRARLEQLGFTVSVMTDDGPVVEEARRAQVVVLSPSVYTRTLNEELITLPVPIVALESSAFTWLGLTGPGWMRDVGNSHVSFTDLLISKPNHPLAAGLSGSIPVLSRRQRLRWGAPGPDAISIGSYAGAPANQSLLFAYEKGSTTPGGTAVGRRVAMFLGNDRIISRLTQQGWRLFDAAVSWSAGDVR